MVKQILFVSSLIIILVLSACGSPPEEASGLTAADTTPQGATIQPVGNETPVGGGAERSMPLAMQLALGTFKLDETDYPIQAGQAEELLPLWKAARSLSESETAAAEEIQALLNQIQETMTPEQLEAIESMGLTFQDMGEIAQELGLDFGSRFGNLSPEMQATMEAARASGQFPGGGFPGGGPGFPGGGPGGGPGGSAGGELSPEQRQTAVAGRGGLRGAGLGFNPALLDAIIAFLETKLP